MTISVAGARRFFSGIVRPLNGVRMAARYSRRFTSGLVEWVRSVEWMEASGKGNAIVRAADVELSFCLKSASRISAAVSPRERDAGDADKVLERVSGIQKTESCNDNESIISNERRGSFARGLVSKIGPETG